MGYRAIAKILGILLMVFSVSMLPPIVVGLWYHDFALSAFYITFIVTLLTGLVLWLPCRNSQQELKTRDGFVIVVLFWTVLSAFGALPFIIADHPQVSITDGVFEAVSGLTTTGSTILTGLSHLPRALIYYRQQLQFLGGMGIIVLAIAILPMLGIGGMQLFRAETPGPIKDSKLTPRIAQTAKTLWYIYVGLTIACTLSYWGAGMPLFFAIGESFSTISTGGFSMHDASFAHYHSNVIDIIGIVFMFLGGVNFGLHYVFLKGRGLSAYYKDDEFNAFVILLVVVSVITCVVLFMHHTIGDSFSTVIKAIFTVVSVTTTTGLTTSDFNLWPTFIPFMLMFVAMIGGCAASTSGGVKVVRFLLLIKQGQREFKRLVHPKAVLPIKFGEQVLPEPVIQAIWGFVGLFIAIFVILLLALLASGLDIRTAFGAAAAAISNTGAAIGQVSSNYQGLSIFDKWILIFAMLAGRLEIFTLLILFTPTFWKR